MGDEMKTQIKLILLCLVCMGCVQSDKVAFDHSSSSEGKMLKDRYDCLQTSMGFVSRGYISQGYGSSSGAAIPNSAMYANCMALKGYTRNDVNGRLVVPPNLHVRTY